MSISPLPAWVARSNAEHAERDAGRQPQLTPAQKRRLEAAARHGHAFADVGVQQRAGGAVRRCVERLAQMGLLTGKPPFELTDAGRKALTPNASSI